MLDSFRSIPALVLVLTAVASMTGCLPIPHTEVDAPSIVGTVAQDKHPVAGARVHRHANGTHLTACAGGDIATTDAQGRFTFERAEHREAWIFFGDESFDWQLAFALPDGACATWNSQGTYSSMPALTCELGPVPAGTTVAIDKDAKPPPPAGVGCGVPK